MTVQYYVLCAPVTLTASNNDIVVSEDGGTDTTISLGVTGDYYVYGDGTEGGDLCKTIADALNNEGTFSNTYTCSYAADVDGTARNGAVTITTDGTSLNIKGADGFNTFDWTVLGHANSTSGPFTSYSGVTTPSATWAADGPPELVDGDRVEGKAIQHRSPAGNRHTFVVDDPVEYRRMRFNFTHKLRVWKRDDTLNGASLGYNTFQYFWETHGRTGKALRLYSENVSSGTTVDTLSSADLIDTYVMSAPLDAWRPTRDSAVPTWAWEIELAEHFS